MSDNHRESCERDFKTAHLPTKVRDMLYRMAYEEHAWGMNAVADKYGDLADLAVLAFEARGDLAAQFVADQCKKFEKAHAEHIATRRSTVHHRQREYDDKALCLDAKVTELRTLATYIARGDDKVPR